MAIGVRLRMNALAMFRLPEAGLILVVVSGTRGIHSVQERDYNSTWQTSKGRDLFFENVPSRLPPVPWEISAWPERASLVKFLCIMHISHFAIALPGCNASGYKRYRTMTTQVPNSASVIMYGTTWCGDCRRAKRVFEQHQTPFEYVDIEQNEEGRAYVERVNRGFQSVPTILFPDGSVLTEPSSAVLAAKLASLGQEIDA